MRKPPKTFESYDDWKEAGRPPFEIDLAPQYGSILGWVEDYDTKWEIYDWCRDAGIKKALRPINQEAVLIRDPRNRVSNTDFDGPSNHVRLRCMILKVVLAEGERKSIYRHRMNRMCLTLVGKDLAKRYEEFHSMGFGSIYAYPLYVIKENPTQSDLENADKHIDSLKERVPVFTITKEIWEKWR